MYWSARTVAEYVADNESAIDLLRSMGRDPMVKSEEVPGVYNVAYWVTDPSNRAALPPDVEQLLAPHTQLGFA